MKIVLNDLGFPVLMADVPNAGVARQDANTKSGNAAHDIHSGKFGSTGGQARTTPPANTQPAEYARMLDAVREAARRFPGGLSATNLQAFVNQRASNPAAVNIQQFAQMATQQQLNDLVDVLDTRTTPGAKLTAPRGWVKKVLAGLSDDDVAEIVARLQARGIKDPHLNVGKGLSAERRQAVKDRHAALQASDQFEWIEESDEDSPAEMSQVSQLDPVQLAEAIARAVPVPEITVEPQILVQVPPPQRVKNTPVRDEKTGLIAYTIQEPLDG